MSAAEHITLSRLQTLIREGIDRAHPLPYWVTAEISELKVNYSGHCYLELVEKGGANHVPRAKMSGVMWRNTYAMLAPYFRQMTARELGIGMQVLIKGVVAYHELYGLSFQITDIDPAYTLGDMERQRRETIERLQREGVYDMNRELELPLVMQRLAVVSSRNAAGYQDFCRELEAGEFCFDLTLFDAFMQGAGAEDSIVAALGAVAEQLDDFDAVIVIRGGGSQSDLGCFDSYRLCCHLAQFPLPVIAGIGHDKDQSVADLVAAVSLKTPTAVAVFLKDQMRQFDQRLLEMADEISGEALTLIDEQKRLLYEAAVRLKMSLGEGLHDESLRLERLRGVLSRGAGECVQRADANLHAYSVQLTQAVRYGIGNGATQLNVLCERLNRAVEHFVQREQQHLQLWSEVVASRHPQRILEMGFVQMMRQGETITSVQNLTLGEQVSFRMADGEAQAQITQIEPARKK